MNASRNILAHLVGLLRRTYQVILELLSSWGSTVSLLVIHHASWLYLNQTLLKSSLAWKDRQVHLVLMGCQLLLVQE